MLDIGWQELLVIGVIALLVVGPKELPGLLRTVGQWAGRARSVAREFQSSMEDAAREADLEEFKNITNVKRDVENMARFDESGTSKAKKTFSGDKSPADTAAKVRASTTPKHEAAAETTGAETVASEAKTAPAGDSAGDTAGESSKV